MSDKLSISAKLMWGIIGAAATAIGTSAYYVPHSADLQSKLDSANKQIDADEELIRKAGDDPLLAQAKAGFEQCRKNYSVLAQNNNQALGQQIAHIQKEQEDDAKLLRAVEILDAPPTSNVPSPDHGSEYAFHKQRLQNDFAEIAALREKFQCVTVPN